jgi:hypothetical protein
MADVFDEDFGRDGASAGCWILCHRIILRQRERIQADPRQRGLADAASTVVSRYSSW